MYVVNGEWMDGGTLNEVPVRVAFYHLFGRR